MTGYEAEALAVAESATRLAESAMSRAGGKRAGAALAFHETLQNKGFPRFEAADAGAGKNVRARMDMGDVGLWRDTAQALVTNGGEWHHWPCDGRTRLHW